jgi:hypothetical protein
LAVEAVARRIKELGGQLDYSSSSEPVKEMLPSSSRNGFAVVAWSIGGADALEGWPQRMDSRPSFETPREERGSSG